MAECRIKTKVYVVGHKEFQIPTDNEIYVPLMVGMKNINISKDTESDRTGDSIWEKNPMYNELTGLYWIWKNSDADITGMCHYRRYFCTLSGKIRHLLFHDIKGILTEKQILRLLSKADIIVHNVTIAKGGNRAQFEKELYGSDLDITRNIIEKLCSEYTEAFDKTMMSRTMHLLNMMICHKEVLDAYCEWLFPILFELEEQLVKNNNGLQEGLDRRVGMVAERLLDVWLRKNNLKYKTCLSVNTERVDVRMW